MTPQVVSQSISNAGAVQVRSALSWPAGFGGWLKAALLAGLLLALSYNVAVGVAADWWEDPAYSHGFVVLPLALSIAWSRRRNLPAARPDSLGLLLTFAACVLYLAGTLGAEFFVTRLACVLLAAGVVWTFAGRDWLRSFAFPLLLLVTIIPLPVILYNQLSAPLQLLASRLATDLLQLANVPIYREGNIIHMAHMSIGVAEACSGLRSVSALAVLALLAGHFERFGTSLRWLLPLLAIPIAIAVNIFRVAGTALLIEYADPELALGFYHSFSGWLVFVGSCALLWAAARLLGALSRFRQAAKGDIA
jgi:exosortase